MSNPWKTNASSADGSITNELKKVDLSGSGKGYTSGQFDNDTIAATARMFPRPAGTNSTNGVVSSTVRNVPSFSPPSAADTYTNTSPLMLGRGRGRGRGLEQPFLQPQIPTATFSTPKISGDLEDNSEEKAKEMAEAALLQKILAKDIGLRQTKQDLEILQRDPKSPLYSVKSFKNLRLKPELLKGIYDMGFNAPSKIQETALPALLADPPSNMIAQSQSGTGKTAAFVLTMLSRVDPSQTYPQCLCLAPTYELALQIGAVTEEMSKHLSDVKICYAVRGAKEKLTANRNETIKEQIVIGTPGTVLDWCTRYRYIDLKKLRVFVLDEADVMIATQGHQDQSVRIKKGLVEEKCQMLLFSATYDDEVMKFANFIIPNAMVIRLKTEELSLDNIKQYYIRCTDDGDKYEQLINLYGALTVGQLMIFCRTKRTASWLSQKMTADGHEVGLLSSELTVEQRAAVINRFKNGKQKVLITTNVSARGIDVEQVTVVCNFDLPSNVDGSPDFETYLHRIGRTGRFGKQGLAINMVDSERSMSLMEAIERHFGRNVHKLNTHDVDELDAIRT